MPQNMPAILNEMSVSSGGSLIYPDISNLGKGTDWQKEIFRTDAPIVSHSISASGGSEKTSYYVSAGFTGQEGLIYGKDKQFLIVQPLERILTQIFQVN